ARAFETDSDRLTERGEAQAAKLGLHLVRAGIDFDEVHTGTLVRQRRTAEIVGEAFAGSGKAFPALEANAGWNEYDAGGILGALLPELVRRDAAFGALVADFHAAAARPDRNRYFQRMFEVLMDAWHAGSLVHEGVESFAAFHGRVQSALRAVLHAGGRGNRRVAVFTSGGPVGVSVQEVLEAPTRSALKLNFRVKNASLTEMVFSEGRVSLETFNVVEYLESSERTFR
ncbi:MAG TPA: histidine phosphatase family protein, partial [Polyangiaceae bacterium]